MMAVLSSETLHASCVAVGGRAILIEGPSGSGKSDLALRLIDRGGVLVSDDYTLVRRQGERLVASASVNLAGKMEIRGLGIVEEQTLSEAPVGLVVTLAGDVERMPEERKRSLAGIEVPVISLDAREASAPIKAERALGVLGR